ncbi:MAG: AlkA N-terminal domain-containing protein [Pseudoxanthomonas sp.]|nr:AlkA N-terminal domain-containing protein [Pseudoxanthomonas sp.]
MVRPTPDIAATALPPPQVCERARLSRDARFDGRFFTAVTSTGIYCRPVCPAPTPKAANVRYFATAAAAEGAGFRPCLRCRPELAPEAGSWRRGDAVLARALALLDGGALDDAPLAALAARVHVGERQLRRLFVERLGAAPIAVHGTRRLLFAKQLLTETRLPITRVALAAGFGSVRRFNTVFRDAYRMAPRDLRRGLADGAQAAPAAADALALRLAYRPPFDFAAQLAFLGARSLPGIDAVAGDGYARTIATASGAAWWSVRPGRRGEHALELSLHGVPAGDLLGVVARVRRLFDLDAEPGVVQAALSTDAGLRPLLRRHPGLRLPGAWDGFEIAVRAVIGQQVSVAAARTLAARLVARCGAPLAMAAPHGLDRLFPSPAQVLASDLDGLGLTRARADTLRAVAHALLHGAAGFDPAQTLDAFIARWCAVPGIGPWTAHYMALRALGHPDAFPAGDLVLRKAAAASATPLSERALLQRADAWRPWRAYAALHLWHVAARAPDRPEEQRRRA